MKTPNSNPAFSLEFLDHVAITVADMDKSIDWYQRVLGLWPLKLRQWGDIPVFMVSGSFGVAIFPTKSHEQHSATSEHPKIDHFAFHVSKENFAKAKTHFASISQEFYEEDHFYFRSLYMNDPDGHKVELTTLSVTDKELKLDIL